MRSERETQAAQPSVPTPERKRRPFFFKVAVTLWIVIVGAVFLLISVACIYFAWEEGWIGFIPKAIILALVALVLAAVVEFLHKK